ncbi:MAG: hypothetical protein ABIO78_02070 [Thermoanaerobaculia bacterium]
MRTCVLSIISLFLASTLFADAKISQKTQVQFGGVLGTAMNVFGGKAAKEGMTSEVSVKKNRRISRTGNMSEIVDLDEEKIYHVDYAKKTYKVTTFAELREQLEEAMKESEPSEKPSKSSKKDPDAKEAKEYEIDFDSKTTGQAGEINGFKTKQVIATVTIREKGMKLQESGGAVLTADMWMAPRIAAVREAEEFERRYIKKLYGDLGVDARSMAAVIALAPEMSKAMKTFQTKQASMDGSAVRSVMTFETVADPRAVANPEEEEASSAANQAAKAIGGFMNRMKKKGAEEKKAPESKTKGGSVLFRSNTELLSASASTPSSDLAIPPGFKEKD